MLNVQQHLAVEHLDGPCIVIAGPGSGKTRVITERVIRLIERGIPQEKILCLTFTNKAANEMRTRIQHRLGRRINSFVGTFHSFCVQILRRYCDKIGYDRNFTILDEDDQKEFLISCIRELDYDKDKIDIYGILKILDDSRENCESIPEIIAHFDDMAQREIAQKYLESLSQHNFIDFSGLLYNVHNLLRDNDEIRFLLQNGWKYILVDEAQDTNYIQFDIINTLSEKHCNIMLTGDIDQSIYMFRNARYQNIQDFIKMHPDIRRIDLGQNYRSTPQIIRAADRLICHNASHIPIQFSTDNPDGHPIIVRATETSQDECLWVAGQIRRLIEEEGYRYNEIAVLYRLNRLSMDLQRVFAMEHIPFITVGGPSFFDRREIKDSIGILRLFNDPSDKLAFHRIISLFDGIGNVTISKIVEFAEENLVSFRAACKNVTEVSTKAKSSASKFAEAFEQTDLPFGNALESVINKIGYFDFLRRKYGNDYQDRIDNIREFIDSAIAFGQTGGTLDGFLQNIALVTSNDETPADGAVTLMTSHASKGLEYDAVFIIGVEKHIMPHDRAINEAADKLEAIGEERRICYVSMTRAKKRLFMSYCRRRNRRNGNSIGYYDTGPSMFLAEAGLLDP